MLAEGSLAEEDLTRIAALHVESIDDSLPALLGPRYGARFYRFVAASPRETLFFERVEGRVESVCVVSEDPATLHARVARATFPALAAAAARAVLRRAAFRSRLRHFLADELSGGSGEVHGPEITYIFTHREMRNRRLGARLLERVDAYLRQRGAPGYYVKTLDDPGNRALAFYAENGFTRLDPLHEAGRRFAVFHKKLDPG